MLKLLSTAIIMILLVSSVIMDVRAIPTRDKQAVIEDLNAYGIDVLDHYPSREPTTADDYYKLAVTYLSRNMPQVAVEQFQKALELNPEHVNSMVGLASSTALLGDVAAALEHSRKALKLDPKSASVRNVVGALRMANATSLDHLKEAEDRFREAISLDSNFVSPRMNLARMYISMRQPKKAIQEYETVIGIQPENLAGHAGLAMACAYAGLLDRAMEEAEKTVELAPENPVPHAILGRVYKWKGQLNEALAEFQKSVELEPTYAPGYRNAGHVHVLTGEPDKAIEVYRKALSYRPNDGETFSGLGNAYVVKGMTQEAVSEYENAIRVLPVSALISVAAYNNLAYIYAEGGKDLDQALSLIQNARKLAPADPDVADTMGWIYYKKELYDEAVTNLEAAVNGSPDNPIMRYHLGLAHYKKGSAAAAAAELKKALEIDSDFEDAEDARRLLNELGM